ncbi:MAG TPA: FtsX-like permease family protein [Streptosporangiaceae bacterium]|nr:FtsX-like permease family protein [Streptosporangiaceae bacterium]
MGKILLVRRLAARDLRHHKAQAVLLLLAITAATTTLVLGLALSGVTSHPYQQTRALTSGPDLVAGYGVLLGPAQGPVAVSAAQLQADTSALIHLSGVTGYSGPYPVASVILRTRGLTVPVQAEGRGQAPAAVDQPKLTVGSWVRPGGVVLERTLAEALEVGVGDRITLDGRPFTVAGIAVTAAAAPYPNCQDTSCMYTGPETGASSSNLSTLNVGLTWVAEADARALASPRAPLSYVLNLKLKDPATAPAVSNQFLFARGGVGAAINSGIDSLYTWQDISSGAGQLVQDQQGVLRVGALLAVLLAVASVAVLAGGRMAERTRRVGLLKAVGSTPGLVAAVLVAENLALALLAAAAGLVIGWAAAPLITNPGAGLIGTAGAPSITLATIGLTVALALAVALASTLVPAVKSARSSTVSALADTPRPPRRRAALIALSARLPVPLLLGIRMAAGRLRRAVLGAASIAVTSAGIVAVLTFRATADHDLGASARQIGDPVVTRDTQMLVVITIVLVTLAVLNAVCAAWATVLDFRRSAALARALGASPRQVSAGVAWAQVLPAVPGALLGIPLGLGLFKLTDTGLMTIPPIWWLAAAVLAILAAVAVMASIPALIGARTPAAQILQSEAA